MTLSDVAEFQRHRARGVSATVELLVVNLSVGTSCLLHCGHLTVSANNSEDS